MKPEIKKKWLKALRSGQYSQTRQQLVSDKGDSFCCLGVLCNLHAEATGKMWTFHRPGTYLAPSYNGSRTYLPKVVQKWAGLKDREGMLPETCRQESLADMNDYGSRFPTIANAIEKYL